MSKENKFCPKCKTALKATVARETFEPCVLVSSFGSSASNQAVPKVKRNFPISMVTVVCVLLLIGVVIVALLLFVDGVSTDELDETRNDTIVAIRSEELSSEDTKLIDYERAYEIYQKITEEAWRIEEKYAVNNYISIEKISVVLDELELLAKEHQERGTIVAYDRQATGIYFELSIGVGYLYTPTVEELLAGDEIGKILTIEPYATNYEFVGNYIISRKSPDASAKKIASVFSSEYSFDKTDNWDYFSFEHVQQMGDHKIIIWYGHGGFVKEVGSVLGTSIPIKDQASLLLYQLELSNKEMILGKDCFYLSSAYFENHIADGSLTGSLIFLGACNSATDSRLAEAFIKKGASLVVGNSQTIRINYMLNMMDDFMSSLTKTYEDGNCWTAEEALAYAKKHNGDKDSTVLAYGAEVVLIYPRNESGYRLCNSKAGESQNGEEIYKLSTEKFQVTAPLSWREEAVIIVERDILYFHEKESYDLGYGGLLCYIMLSEDREHGVLPHKELGSLCDEKGNVWYVVCRFPTDVPFDPENGENYIRMREEIERILFSLQACPGYTFTAIVN